MLFALIMYLLGLQVKYREGMTVVKNSFQAFVFAARPNTLTASVAPVLVGATFAAMDIHPLPDRTFGWIQYLVCLGFAIGMQVASNLIGDLHSCKRGTGGPECPGSPSACAMGWVDAGVMKKWIARVLAISVAIWSPAVLYAGWTAVAIGIACVLSVFLYTSFFSSRGMGDILVLVFLGLVPVCLTYYMETMDLSWRVVAVSVGTGLVVDMLLVAGSFRDCETDSRTGKRTLTVILGKRAALWAYLAMGLAGPLSTLVLLPEGKILPSLMTVPFIVLHAVSFLRMKRTGNGRVPDAVPESAATDIFIFGFLLSAGFLLQNL